MLVCQVLQVLRGKGLTAPAALAGLTSLQRCYLQRNDSWPGAAGTAPPLPGGPWLHTLRWLGANIDTLANSTAALHAATNLEFVEANEARSPAPFGWHWPSAGTLLDWLAGAARKPCASVLSCCRSNPFRACS